MISGIDILRSVHKHLAWVGGGGGGSYSQKCMSSIIKLAVLCRDKIMHVSWSVACWEPFNED